MFQTMRRACLATRCSYNASHRVLWFRHSNDRRDCDLVSSPVFEAWMDSGLQYTPILLFLATIQLGHSCSNHTWVTGKPQDHFPPGRKVRALHRACLCCVADNIRLVCSAFANCYVLFNLWRNVQTGITGERNWLYFWLHYWTSYHIFCTML